MTTYKNTEFTTAEDLRNAINSDLEQLAYPFTVKHRIYGEGQLTFIKAPLTGGSLYATVDFAAGSKTLSLDVILSNNLLEMPEALIDTVLEAQTIFKTDFIEREEAQRLADRQAREEAAAAKKQAEEEKKNEEKFQRHKAIALREFDELIKADRPVSASDEFYYTLGYVAKHAGTVSAALPDYLESAFKSHFGSEVPCRVVDSTKKGPAGFTSQWTRSFSISLKKPESVPTYLSEYLNPTGKAITDTDFVLDLIENYGFKFGKEQNIEEIRSHVPSQYLTFFEAGLA